MSLEIEILPNGEIKIPRNCTPEEQSFILNIALKFISDEKKIQEINDFFKENNNRKIILGNKVLCG